MYISFFDHANSQIHKIISYIDAAVYLNPRPPAPTQPLSTTTVATTAEHGRYLIVNVKQECDVNYIYPCTLIVLYTN